MVGFLSVQTRIAAAPEPGGSLLKSLFVSAHPEVPYKKRGKLKSSTTRQRRLSQSQVASFLAFFAQASHDTELSKARPICAMFAFRSLSTAASYAHSLLSRGRRLRTTRNMFWPLKTRQTRRSRRSAGRTNHPGCVSFSDCSRGCPLEISVCSRCDKIRFHPSAPGNDTAAPRSVFCNVTGAYSCCCAELHHLTRTRGGWSGQGHSADDRSRDSSCTLGGGANVTASVELPHESGRGITVRVAMRQRHRPPRRRVILGLLVAWTRRQTEREPRHLSTPLLETTVVSHSWGTARANTSLQPIAFTGAMLSKTGREPGYKKTNQDSCFMHKFFAQTGQSLFGCFDGGLSAAPRPKQPSFARARRRDFFQLDPCSRAPFLLLKTRARSPPLRATFARQATAPTGTGSPRSSRSRSRSSSRRSSRSPTPTPCPPSGTLS